jgi:hypothetical protein
MKKELIMSLVIVWIVIMGVVAFVIYQGSQSKEGGQETPQETDVIEREDGFEIIEEEQTQGEKAELTQATCESAGGTWDACGSACRGEDVDVCIELCVTYCECETSDQCPSGYVCGDYVDQTGICL